MKILDCTLRDGGYYNNWDFDFEVVNAYLTAVAAAKIDYVELGLRNFPQEGFLGPFAYTTESLVNRLTLPEGPAYGVMIDAKTVLSANMPVEEAIDKLFVDASKSKLSLVRVAAHFHEVEHCEAIIKSLKNKGYIVGFNLMQSGGKPDDLIADKASLAVSWNCLDVLYFADSLGNMDTTEVRRIIKALRMHWEGELGIHTHNNMAKALDNTLAARDSGVIWLDVTVTGMGRGAGNAQTENLLAVLSKTDAPYLATPIYDLVVRHFDKMQKESGWGSNFLYFIGAQNNVHPTYVQNLLSNERYGPDEIVGAIAYLSRAQASSYNGKVLEQALKLNDQNDDEEGGSSELVGRFTNREILIIGSGDSVLKYKNGIIDYISEHKPIVLSINVNKNIPAEYVDYYIISHNTKFLADKSKYSSLTKPLILPKHRFNKDELSYLSPKTEIFDYGLKINKDVYQVAETQCTIPSELTVGYAISAAIIGQSSSIKLVGFDGFEKGDSRQQEMVDLIIKINEYMHKKEIISLTPTSYPIKEGSVYAPLI
ncbi:4-hydroxy 2-oxovalerate aldolase|uniref:4-hydroxy 2-oxovalerate aldolase n=2 Tax=Enterobacterales TaxID=91347 RepID=A0A366I169_9GAMM|nr:aldolase catalytic domain-containing protein [Brenneria salicis]NMN92143.1 4-hydroxy 2-oxovalerate aldolase [Brenneria salicis ATCC 15712 = DSM 30166]RBP61133.1 4-hydroxy 2-oxovalerate aldolase [Brenneria salicis ATCC 15712 = DSM 30166]RLM28713.1 pyruvate carboxyltransferase [Brenneria salicis ATCC 15712 = DSM 30166]